MTPTRRARRGVARDGPGGELALPSLLRREFASLLQLLRGADRVIPRQHVTGAARVSSSSKRSVWYVRAEGGLGWGLPPPVSGLWAPLKVLALTGRMGCAGGCPAGLRESLLALRRWEGRVEIASGRGAWSHILFVGVPTGSRSIGAKHAHGRRGIRRRMRGRNASIGHARARVAARMDRTGGSPVENGAARAEVAERPVAKGPEGPGEVPPWDEKGAASAGYAPARIRDERAGDSPHGATFVAVTLHVERILVEEHVDACEAPPRPRTTVVRPDEGARAFRWLTDDRARHDSWDTQSVMISWLIFSFAQGNSLALNSLTHPPKGTSKSSNPPSAFAAASAAAPFSSDCERLSERRSCARANAAAPAGVSDERF